MQEAVTSSPVLTRSSKVKTSRSTTSLAATANKKTSSPRLAGEGERGGRRQLPEGMKRGAYTAWCALKTARQAQLARESFQSLSSQLHHPELAKTLPDKALGELPDFALLELGRGESGEDESLASLLLTTSDSPPPLDALLSTAQLVQTQGGLTWFQVLGLSYSILVRCFWPPASGPVASWLPHTHTLTSSLHTRCHALLSFLHQHCPTFATSCTLPTLPPSLIPTPTPSKMPPPGGPILGAPSLHHLRASDAEVTVVWCRPPPNSPTRLNAGGSHDHPDDVMAGSRDQQDYVVVGVFGFNQRSLKQPQPGSTGIPAVEVFSVRMRSGDLGRLREVWDELLEAAQDYLGGRLSGRPVSRSPSRLRKQAEKTQRIQAGLQVPQIMMIDLYILLYVFF